MIEIFDQIQEVIGLKRFLEECLDAERFQMRFSILSLAPVSAMI